MENTIALNFHLDFENSDLSLTLMRVALDRLEQLEEAGIPVEFFELRAGNPKPGQSVKKFISKLTDQPILSLTQKLPLNGPRPLKKLLT